MDKCLLSIVIPAYNEEERILPSLRKIYSYLSAQDFSFEVIVVDDGSTDNTAGIVKNFTDVNKPLFLTNGKNKGKGFTVKSGMLAAKGEYVFFTDADLSTPIEEVSHCLPYLSEGHDIVIGSRSLPDSDVRIHQPWYREKMGRVFNLIVTSILMRGIVDTQCGFKGFRRNVIEPVFRRSIINGFSFDVEILYIANKHNFNIKEVPVRWENSTLSKVSPIKDSLQMFIDLLGIRLKNIKGAYD